MTASKPRPGEPVLVVALPMPVTSLALIGDLVERVWGTGETMLKFDGDLVRVMAPKDGFGPLKTSGRRPTRPSNDDAILTSLTASETGVSMELADAEERIHLLLTAMRSWFDLLGAKNYLETSIGPLEGEPEFTVIMQKRSQPTPHDLRVAADARVEKLRAALENLSGEEFKALAREVLSEL